MAVVGTTHTQVMCEVLVGGSVFGIALLAVVVTVLIAVAGRDGGHSRRLQFDDIFDPAFKPELVCHNSPPLAAPAFGHPAWSFANVNGMGRDGGRGNR